MTRAPIDVPPILSVDLIQITDKTSIPFAEKAAKTLEKIKKKEEKRVVSEQAPPSEKKKKKEEKRVVSEQAPPSEKKKRNLIEFHFQKI